MARVDQLVPKTNVIRTDFYHDIGTEIFETMSAAL